MARQLSSSLSEERGGGSSQPDVFYRCPPSGPGTELPRGTHVDSYKPRMLAGGWLRWSERGLAMVATAKQQCRCGLNVPALSAFGALPGTTASARMAIWRSRPDRIVNEFECCQHHRIMCIDECAWLSKLVKTCR